MSISPDGRTLLFAENDLKTGVDLMSLPLGPLGTNSVHPGSAGDKARSALPLVQTPFADTDGEVSPDGRWLAYQSTDSGRPEIYVRPFPDVKAGRTQVSSGGGRTPLWDRRDARCTSGRPADRS
jgi:serine/threonine-protein kinase